MGDVVERRKNSGWRVLIAGAVLVAASVVGCTSSKSARVVEAQPAAPEQAPAATDAKTAPASAEIRSLDLREGAPEVFVDLVANAPLVWTSFRNAEGKVVVELPNAVAVPAVADLSPDQGLISSVKIQRENEGSRPLVRLIIETRHEVEHSVSAEGTNLQVRLQPMEEQGKAAKLSFEPVPESAAKREAKPIAAPPAAPVKVAAAPAPQAPAPAAPVPSRPVSAAKAGTPDEPAVAPAPSGAPATRLEGIEVLASQGGSVVRISGDGEFPYSTFALEEPNRFVIDLQGVVNRSPRSTLTVQGGVVERVRVAQFKPVPRAVARIVFDLRSKDVPRIERTPQGLVVSFGGSAAAPVEAMAPAPAPAKTARVVVTPPPPAPMPAPAPVPTRSADASDLALRSDAAPGVAPAKPAPKRGTVEIEDTTAIPRVAKTAALKPANELGGVRQLGDSKPAPKGDTKTPAKGTTKSGSGSTAMVAPSDTFAPQSVGEGEKTYVGEPIDLKVTNADVTDVLRTFAQISGLNIVVQPGVSGTVTAELENVPWDQALEQVLKINNLGYELEGNVMRIAPTAILRTEATERQQLVAARALAIPLRTVLKRLSYADAQQVAGLLRNGQSGLLSQRGSVIVDQRTNTLIIKELPNFLDAVLSVVENLDSPEPQVMIEARIIETSKSFSRSLGIDWGFSGVADNAHGNTTGLIFPNNGTIGGNVTLDQGAQNGLLKLHLGNVLNTFQLDAALQLAETEGLINILSAPKIATLNNQVAEIQTGTQIPVQTIANGTVTVQFVNATLRLDVIPQVTAEGTVLMSINISKRQPNTALLIPGSTTAPIDTRDATTRLVVRDGATAVIGGIYKVTTNQGESRVPGLANIPLLGNLFKNKTRSEDNEELLIFITPRVIKF